MRFFQPMSVSVVILTANRRAHLERCLRSLDAQTRLPDQLLVVENGSKDDTAAFLDRWRGSIPLRVLRRDGSGSFAEARNAGVQAASGTVIVFLDDDCEADRWWLERLLAPLEAGAAAIGGAVLPANFVEVPETYSPHLAWATGCSPPGFFGPRAGIEVLPQTANLAVRAEVLRKHPFQVVGGSLQQGRENYDTGREDADWWNRLRREGLSLAVASRAIVWHHIPASRYRIEEVEDRAARDGQARWLRDPAPEAADLATEDITEEPLRLLYRISRPQVSTGQAMFELRSWRRRQAALLRSAVDDNAATYAPTRRSTVAAVTALRMLASLGKAALRTAAATAWHAARPAAVEDYTESPRSVLVVLHPFLGDAVLALPMLRQLEQGLPGADLHLILGPTVAPLLKTQLPRWRFHPPPASGHVFRRWKSLHALVDSIAPEATILAYAHRLPVLPILLAARGPVIGWPHDNGTDQKLWGQLLDRPVEKRWDQHEVVALLNLAGALGIWTRLEHPTLTVPPSAREKNRELLRKLGAEPGRYVVLHVEQEDRFKYWSAGKWGEVARLLWDAGWTVLLEGSRRGRGAADRVRELAPSARSLHGMLGTVELAALLADAGAFAGGDSGPAHVAAAVGCPSAVLFGVSDERRWGPLPPVDQRTDPRRVLRAVAREQTEEERRRLGEHSIMEAICASDVAKTILELLTGEKQGD